MKKMTKSVAVAITMLVSAGAMFAPATFAATGGAIEFAEAPQTNLTWFIPMFNAANDSVANSQLIDQLYKPMLWINNDYSINWKSSIADKVTYNSQGTVYHVFLNKKWKWSNGQPVTTKDVMFTWNMIKAASASNAPAPWPFVGAGTGDIPNGIKNVVANNPYELTITLDKPANQQWFEYNGIIQLTPMPAAVWDKYSNPMQEVKYLGANATKPTFDTVVDGPFKMQSGIENQAWTIVPNPTYPGHKSTVSKIVFNYESSNTQELAALRTGQLNVGYLDQSEIGSEGVLTSVGDTVKPEYGFGIFWTEMNMWPGSPTKSIFDQLYVRQALQMSVDSVGISQDIYKGYAVPLTGPIPPTPRTKYLDPKLANPLYPYNLAKAKQLLTSHGWKMKNGVMQKGNQKMSFTMLVASGTTAGTDTAELMKQDWAQIGVNVTIKLIPFSTEIAVTSNKSDHSWALATGSGWFYNGPGFYPTGGQLFASTAPSGTGFADPKEDALIAATHTPYANSAITMQHFMAYEDYTAKVLPFLWGQNIATLQVVGPNAHNVYQYLDSATAFPQMQYWTVS